MIVKRQGGSTVGSVPAPPAPGGTPASTGSPEKKGVTDSGDLKKPYLIDSNSDSKKTYYEGGTEVLGAACTREKRRLMFRAP